MHVLALTVILFPETPELLIEVHAEKRGLCVFGTLAPVFKKASLLKSQRRTLSVTNLMEGIAMC